MYYEDLLEESEELLRRINAQIQEVEAVGALRNVSPSVLIDTTGGYILTPLLQAKAVALNAIASIKLLKQNQER